MLQEYAREHVLFNSCFLYCWRKKKIAEYNILVTPGLVINGNVKCSGRIPSKQEIKEWIEEENK